MLPSQRELPSIRPGSKKSKGRERELRWIETHREDLRKLVGQWIVLENETIVAHGRDPVEVVREARRKGIRTPLVYRVKESRAKGVVDIGL